MAKITFSLDTKLLVPAAIVIGSIIIAAAIILNGGGDIFKKSSSNEINEVELPPGPPTGALDDQDGNQSDGQPAPLATDIKTDGEPYIGDPDAPVKLVYYGDFQCPFCKRFETQILPALKEKYIDTGKAVFYFKNYQFLGPDSLSGGVASECLFSQVGDNLDVYWKWHAAMFERQDGENSGFGNADDIKKLVKELNLASDGVEVVKFESCLDNRETEDEVLADLQEGQLDGVRGTPATFVNGRLVSGAQPVQVFSDLIEAELAK